MEDLLRIQDLANECLNCKKPMCKNGCPISTNIPEFIQCIRKNELMEAYKILQENNILSEICSIICPTEIQCKGNCVKGIKGQPVNINELENFVNKWAKENKVNFEIKKECNNNYKIAIIGAGPSGIACATELAKMGYDVTIFEKEKSIGGILEYEIPDFRLSKDTIKSVKEQLKKMNIKLCMGIEFGKDINLEDLRNYKAIFLGIGAYVPKKYKLTEKNTHGVYTANEILRKYHNKEKIEALGKTVVIGGGNVAIDVARVVNKLQKEQVQVVYRRTKQLMPAIKSEVEEAVKEGVDFIYNTKVLEAICNNENKIKKLKCIKTKIENEEVINIENSEFEIEADSVIFAIGLGIDENLLKKLEIETENGLVKIDENNMTSHKGIFAGGDLVENKPTVCKAIATGKKAAKRNKQANGGRVMLELEENKRNLIALKEKIISVGDSL